MGCQAAHRGGEPPRAMRRDEDIAPYRHAARWRGCAAWVRATIAPGARPCRAPCRGRGTPAGKPRHAKLSACATCKAAHRAVARRRDGDIAPYRQATRGVRTATGHEWAAMARGSKPRTAVASRHGGRRGGASREGGEPPRAVAAKHRALSPSRTRGEHGIGTRRWCAAMRLPF